MRTQNDDQREAARRFHELPRVLEVRSARVRYPEPRVYYVGEERRQASEAVELLVRTERELPARAITPALFIGEVPVAEYETVGDRLYRFYAYDLERLQPGAPIALGWPRWPERKVATGFQFQPGGGPLA